MKMQRMSSVTGVFALLLGAALSVSAAAPTPETGRWADANDPVAKKMIEQERRWAEDACTPSDVAKEALADDFVGTSPRGPIYDKKEATAKPSKPEPLARACKLLSARVRFFGESVAVIYGKETAIHKDAAGNEKERVLIWTDTWMKREGKWQIIAVQDMVEPKS
jgi:hypothetical protein